MCLDRCIYVAVLVWSEGHGLGPLEGGLQFSEYESSKSYHLMVSVGLEDVGGHLSAMNNVLNYLLKLFLLEGQSSCLGQ